MREYTPEEKALVRRLYDTHTASEIAAQIHGTPRSAKSIYQLAHQLGLRKWPDRRDLWKKIRRLHSQSLPDRVIAKRLGITHDCAKEIRRGRLKLPCNRDLEGKRQAVRTQMQVLGLRSPTQLRTRAWRLYAIENGWPEDLRPREVQILNTLAARGPMTMMELAQAIGMRTDRIGCNGRPALLVDGGRYGTYTAGLLKRGLIVYLPRWLKGRPHGKVRTVGHYILSANALAIFERSLQCQNANTTQHGSASAAS